MTATVAIIVPVLGRPHHAAPFVESLRATTPRSSGWQVYAIVEYDDSVCTEAWGDGEGAYVLSSPERHTFAEKVAYAYDMSNAADWYCLVGSDVVFKPHWFESAMKVADRTGAGLIATNDLGNPRVMAGTHATHPLISRRYIEEKGASWDGPGTIVHTGYRHSHIDDEWSVKALIDGEFAFARRSEIEHRHPAWGKAESDWVYEKGMSSFQEDKALFLSRLRKYTDLLEGDGGDHA